MGNTSLGVRMITYRARHRLSQRAFAELMGETLATIYRVENNIHKPHKINEIRLSEKMDKLEFEERGKNTND